MGERDGDQVTDDAQTADHDEVLDDGDDVEDAGHVGDEHGDAEDDHADADPDEGDDDDEPFTPPTRAGADDDRVRVRELVLLAVAVIGIAGTLFMGLRWRDADEARQDLQEVEDDRTEVATAAEEFFVALFDWDGTTIDADFDEILSFATGEFEEEAQTTFNDDQTREDLRANRAATRLDDVDTFVRSVAGDDARVFGVVAIRAANAEFPEARADTVRVEIGLRLEGGEWKVYDVNLLDGLSLGLPSDPGATGG